MTQWLRRTYAAPGMTQAPPGPHVAAVARRAGRAVRISWKADSRPGGLYAGFAGLNYIPGVALDQHGNALGSEYDLIDDGSIVDATIVVLNLCSEVVLDGPRHALERKGFTCIETRDTRALDDLLSDAAELWLISDAVPRLRPTELDSIESFFREGRGLYIWGDNDPYYADANRLLERLFGVAMVGNTPGDRVVSVREAGDVSGLVPEHLVTTGLTRLYEGITIAEIPTTPALVPLVYGSNGRVVTACHDEAGLRAIVDGGFTRLYNRWDTAGTGRFVTNAAAWLLNIERFDDGRFTA